MEDININNTLFHFAVNQSPEDLRFYTQTKLNIADQLRIVHEGLKTLGRDDAENDRVNKQITAILISYFQLI